MKKFTAIIILILVIKNILFSQFNSLQKNINSGQSISLEDYRNSIKQDAINSENKFQLWKRNSFFRGANIHPYKIFSPFTMQEPITIEDLKEIKKLGANLVVANFPGVFTYYPPYEIDSLHLRNLDRVVEMTSKINLNLVIAIRSGPGRSLYSFFDKEREDEFVLVDSIARNKYLEMCRFISARYQNYKHLVGINFYLEPHSDDPINLEIVSDSLFFNFIEELIENVREVDKSMPIIVQPMSWAYPNKFTSFKKFNDDKIVYSFDMYFPHSFTNEKNDSTYPGFYFMNDSVVFVDSNYLRIFLQPVINFKEQLDVPIFVNEYGGIRYKNGFVQYLKDLHQIFLENGFHFAYYVWKSEWGELDGNSFDDFNYQKGSDLSTSKKENELMQEFQRVWKMKR